MKFKGIKFHKINCLRFVDITIDYYNHPELFEKDIQEIIGDVTNAVVKINIKVSLEDNYKVDLETIKKITSKSFYCKEVVPSIVKQKRTHNPKITSKTNLMDAIRLFIKDKNPKGYRVILDFVERLIKDVKLDNF